jgi:anti-sigma factor RsiW
MKEVNAPICGRENDLIAFLYGELNDQESRTFQRHLNDCSACSTEVAGLRDIRQSVVGWRNESLGGVFSPVRTVDSSPIRFDREKPSAVAALREFFKLAPFWMKGAVAFASILFCLFAGIAIARLRATPQAVVVATPEANASEERVNAVVQRRVQEELAKIKKTPAATSTAAAGDNGAKQNSSHRITRRDTIASNDPTQKARRPLSKTEREQLAADLRLVSARNDGELDLLDDGINQ